MHATKFLGGMEIYLIFIKADLKSGRKRDDTGGREEKSMPVRLEMKWIKRRDGWGMGVKGPAGSLHVKRSTISQVSAFPVTSHSAVTMCQTMGFPYGCGLGPTEPGVDSETDSSFQLVRLKVPKHLFRVALQRERRAFKKGRLCIVPGDKDRMEETARSTVGEKMKAYMYM